MGLEVITIMLKVFYKKYDNRTFDNTENITKHINNYSTHVTNNYKIDKINNVTKTYYNFNDDITLNKTSNNYYNDTYNITKINSLTLLIISSLHRK